jgi:hypothetical protein
MTMRQQGREREIECLHAKIGKVSGARFLVRRSGRRVPRPAEYSLTTMTGSSRSAGKAICSSLKHEDIYLNGYADGCEGIP